MWRERSVRIALAVMLALAMMPFAGVATAASVEPVMYKGNPTLCEDGLKLDPPPPIGTTTYSWSFGDPPTTVTVTVSVYYTDMGMEFDWSSDHPISRVVAKGGREGAHIYEYPSGTTGDVGLHAPMNPSGKWADLSWVGFCPGMSYDDPPVEPEGVLSGAKYYDRDMDGTWDLDEPPLAGWPITLVAEDYSETVMTNDSGEFYFSNLPAGRYEIHEATPPVGSCWHQTAPEGGYYELYLDEDEIVSGLDFGNVCMTTTTGGYTIGYWGNKNGQAVLAANPGWMALLSGLNLVKKDGTAFDPVNYAGFKSWLQGAEATNMSYMLSAQLAATKLNIAYNGADYSGYGIVLDGGWMPIGDVIDAANAFLAAHPVTTSGSGARMMAEMYKDILDDLNNNRLVVIPYDPCPLPEWE